MTIGIVDKSKLQKGTEVSLKGMMVAGTTALALAAGGVINAPSEAHAATGITIRGVSKANAADKRSKGRITTPSIGTSGNVAVAKRSFKIYKGKKRVYSGSTERRNVRLKMGTYKVKSTVIYRTFTLKKVKTVDRWYWVSRDGEQAWEGSGDGDFANVNANNWCGHPINVTLDPEVEDGQLQSFPVDCVLWDPWNMDDTTKRETHGTLNFVFDRGMWGENGGSWYYVINEIRLHDVQYRTDRVYSSYKTAARAQTVKISNSGVMTYYEYKKIKMKSKKSTVKKIVGGLGKHDGEYTYGKSTYEWRLYPGYHYVLYRNGKVYSKSW